MSDLDWTDLECVTCHAQFSCPEAEIDFFTERGWPTPVRCVSCRRTRKAQREAAEARRG